MSALTMSRPLVAPRGYGSTITAADDDCDTCFGTGQIYAKPGVYKPCPACCGGFTLATVRVVPVRGPVLTAGCAACGCACGTGPACSCTCCCSYEPAVAAASIGGCAMTTPDPRSRDLFDVLDELGVDLDSPEYAGMDAFDVAELLGVSGDDEEAGQR